ncbi:MAG: hypothetical protein JO356_01155, partial [Acidobacteria bacterium]|nr:hypothetical protein [Acidobacteriota bacterium]
MSFATAEKLRAAVSQEDWNEVVALLQKSSSFQAAQALRSLAFDQQERLFVHLPLDLASQVI